jgi:uncharacterized protein
MTTVSDNQLLTLYNTIKDFYNSVDLLPFHGWHHVEFVYRKAKVFADTMDADINITQSAALVHDLNYVEVSDEWSPPNKGESIRQTILKICDYNDSTIQKIEEIVITADISVRGQHDLSPEAMALSDADTLFKALPVITPVFTARFMAQTNYGLRTLADKILSEQKPLLDKGNYFYSNLGKRKYEAWAQDNMKIWENINKSLADPEIISMLNYAGVNVE